MICSIEGSPATGKTTISKILAQNRYCARIAEVNETYPRPNPEPKFWYLHKQIDRWTEAVNKNGDDSLIILDGDHFQPIWFSWMYPDRVDSHWRAALNFYIQNITRPGLPDFYVYLWVSPSERLRREHERGLTLGHSQSRIMAKFDRYRNMMAMQRAVFGALDEAFPGFVLTLEASELEQTAESIRNYGFTPPPAEKFFNWMRNWLSTHDASQFLP